MSERSETATVPPLYPTKEQSLKNPVPSPKEAYLSLLCARINEAQNSVTDLTGMLRESIDRIVGEQPEVDTSGATGRELPPCSGAVGDLASLISSLENRINYLHEQVRRLRPVA